MIKKYAWGLAMLSVLLAPGAWAGGGFSVYTSDINSDTEQTILPPGTLNVGDSGVKVELGLTRSGGTMKFFSQSLQYGGTTFFLVEELRFELEANGSFTVRRTGSQTYSLVVRTLWIT